MKPLKQKVSITLDEDIIEKVRVLAEDCDRSFSQYVNLALKEYLNINSSVESVFGKSLSKVK